VSDLSDVGGILGGGALATVVARYIWETVKGRKDHLEQKVETTTEAKLDALVAGQGRMELELRDMRNALSNQNGEMTGIRDRVNGISADYGPRIKELELWRASSEGKRRR
jgi:hypothetical protein